MPPVIVRVFYWFPPPFSNHDSVEYALEVEQDEFVLMAWDDELGVPPTQNPNHERVLAAENSLAPNPVVRSDTLSAPTTKVQTQPLEDGKEDTSESAFLVTKVSRKEYNTPEVREAMIQQIETLQYNGTYEEVQRKDWMNVIPSLWVINRHTEMTVKMLLTSKLA